MNEKLTFVPASEMGPHYVDAGLRPEGDPRDSYSGIRVHCIAQFIEANEVLIRPAVFLPITGKFMVFDQLVEPICWWHLPQAVPNTEREWFDKAGMEKGYEVEQWEVDGHLEYRAMLYPWRGELYPVIDEAVDDAYEHWVASGRP